jgi:hypothetical protein
MGTLNALFRNIYCSVHMIMCQFTSRIHTHTQALGVLIVQILHIVYGVEHEEDRCVQCVVVGMWCVVCSV